MDKNKKIIELREKGLSYGSIAKMMNLSRARIHQICESVTREDLTACKKCGGKHVEVISTIKHEVFCKDCEKQKVGKESK